MEKTASLETDNIGLNDLDGVIAIESVSYPSPWPRRVFEREIKADNSYKRVIRLGGLVVGYIVTWTIYDEVHILNIAVHPDYRKMGIGEKLISDCLSYSSGNGLKYAILEVRVSNKAARNLYHKIGFRQIQLRKNYYSDTGEDGIVMMYELQNEG